MDAWGKMDFPVVGLGASAGGLKALSAFFTAIEARDARPGMAFVVITHLAPEEESHLAELLQHRTRLPVTQVADSTEIEVDHVYVLRPNQTLLVRRGRLEPQARSADVPPHPVDDLFRSLGVECGPWAVAITLSGTGPNGSAGLPTVKENGGLILAQTQESCDFPDMPRNAVATGLVDAVLPPDQMIEVLARYA
ncbi:MAG: hypothetical protein GEU92_07020 [Alphaproteobacteria bacterium]|nr:hypothetical protein [Alphaproteobacteria bacterium]